MNIFEKALNFATNKEILADTSWSVEYMKNILGLENYNQFQEDGKEYIHFYGPVYWNGKRIPVRGDMSKIISETVPEKEIHFFITFDDLIPGINLNWLYNTSHLFFEELETDHYPFTKVPILKLTLEDYDVEIMIDVDRSESVTGFSATLIKHT